MQVLWMFRTKKNSNTSLLALVKHATESNERAFYLLSGSGASWYKIKFLNPSKHFALSYYIWLETFEMVPTV